MTPEQEGGSHFDALHAYFQRLVFWKEFPLKPMPLEFDGKLTMVLPGDAKHPDFPGAEDMVHRFNVEVANIPGWAFNTTTSRNFRLDSKDALKKVTERDSAQLPYAFPDGYQAQSANARNAKRGENNERPGGTSKL